jgi:Probable Zinc-ribbon domain
MNKLTAFALVLLAPVMAASMGCDAIWGLQRADLLQPDAGSTTTGTTSTGTTGTTSTGTAGTTSTGTTGTGGASGSGGAMNTGGGPVGSEVWGEGFQDSTWNYMPSPTGIAVDNNGNTVVTGSYLGKIAFSQTPGDTLSAKSICSLFLASFDETGVYNWGTSFDVVGSNDSECPSASVAVDAQGDVYFATTLGAASVQVGSSTYDNPSQIHSVLMASFASSGSVRWVKVFGSTMGDARAAAIAVDSQDDVAVTGSYTGMLTFAPLAPLAAGNGNPMFLAEVDTMNGDGEWSASFGDVPGQPPGSQGPSGLAIDANNAVVVTGAFGPSMQLGTYSLLSVGGTDIFLAKYAFGSVQWANSYGGPKDDVGAAVAIDPGGDVLLFGQLGATGNLGGGNIPVQATGMVPDGFVAKYNGADKYQWAKVFGGTPGVLFSQASVASDVNSNVVLAGATYGPVGFGGSPVTPVGGMTNVFFAKLGAGGSQDWLKIFGDASGQGSPVVATDPRNQEIIVAFGNNGTVNLGSTTVVSTPSENVSLVVARFSPYGRSRTSSMSHRIKRALADDVPAVAAEWHPTKNGALRPSDVGRGTRRKVWWRCSKDPSHVWEARVFSRAGQGAGCPVCAGTVVTSRTSLQTCFPAIAAEWDKTGNGLLTPNDLLPKSNRICSWRCAKCKHIWRASPQSRARGRGCPACAHQVVTPETSLAARFPTVAAGWHPTKNRPLTPDSVTAYSNRRCWWVCDDPNCGQAWQARVADLARGRGCPECTGRSPTRRRCLAMVYPAVAAEWHSTKNGALTPEGVAPHSGMRAWWRCVVHPTHVWATKVSNRTSRGSGCPFCARSSPRAPALAMPSSKLPRKTSPSA